jgi:hypothetical protein
MRRLWEVVILAVGISAAYAAELPNGPARSAPEQWKPVDQPALAETFSAAKSLKLEDVCDGPDSCWVGPQYWVPNPDGKTYDLILFYYPKYHGPHEVIIFDLGTGQLKRQEIDQAGGQTHMFHTAPTWLIGGKLIIKTLTYSEPAYWVYDPATNELKLGERIGDGKLSQLGGWAFASDGTIYGVAQLKGTRQLACYRIDPTTWKSEVLTGPVGPDHKNMAGIYATYATEGDWVYAAVGNTPWRLYAFNVRTHDGKVIAESENTVGDYKTMRLEGTGGYNACRLTTDKGLPGIGGPGTYWLKEGKVLKGEGANPPPPIEKRAAPAAKVVDMGMDRHHMPPGVELHRMPVSLDGTVRLWYRLQGQALVGAQGWADAKAKAGDWGKIEFAVKYSPFPVRHIRSLPDGRIFTLTEGYGRAVMIDPAKGNREVLGPTMSVYTVVTHGDRIYLSGYPSCQVWEYDVRKPWTVGRVEDQPPASKIDEENPYQVTAPDSNPKLLAMAHDSGLHNPIAMVGPAADGRIYFGGVRIRVANGGGFGWWDPKERKAGGFFDPFTAYQIFWMCLAGEGRYVVLSTKPSADDKDPNYTPKEGRLFVYDTREHKMIHAADAGFWTPGYICEALPGLVLGFAATGDKEGEAGGVLYGFDPAAGKILWAKAVPKRPVTGRSTINRGAYYFDKGPDGFIWATMGDVLARIDPRTAEVSVVGKFPGGQIAFSGDSVYVSGADKLRRIVGVSAVRGEGRP